MEFQFTFSAIYDGLQFWWTSLDGVRGGWTSEGYYRRITPLSRHTNNSMHAHIWILSSFLPMSFILSRKRKWRNRRVNEMTKNTLMGKKVTTKSKISKLNKCPGRRLKRPSLTLPLKMNERSVKINEMVWKNKIGGMDEKKDEMRIKIDL